MAIISPKIFVLLKYILLYIFVLHLYSCKKDNPNPDTRDIDKSKTYLGDETESKLRDSVWYYYKALSLWQDVIPPTKSGDQSKIDEIGFIRNNYTKYFETATNVLDYLKGITKSKRPIRSNEKDYDWYSILNSSGSIKNEVKNGVTSGFGMYVVYLRKPDNNNSDLYVRNVESGSGADYIGLQRGDQILAINGDSNLDYLYQKQRDFEPLLGYFKQYSITIQYKKASDGSIVNGTLFNRSYSSKSVSDVHTISLGNRKVGYFMYNYFSSNNSELRYVFDRFQQEGINELVIDLRYNEGGDVLTAEYVANWLAPASESGKLMYTYTVNNTIRDWGWAEDGDDFGPVRFYKIGNLSLNRVYFLVSSYTASASELLINSLKPVMNTYMVGTYSLNENNVEVADRTYGKPVGFFEYKVNDLYVGSFKMFNRNGDGDYFDGLIPNTHVWEFANLYNFGNPQEPMLAAALNHIETGSFHKSSVFRSTSGKSQLSNKAEYTQGGNHQLNNRPSFGMFKFKKLSN